MAELREAEEAAAEFEAGAADTTGAAVALALDGARHDPHLREDIKAYLGRQQVLMSAQIEHLHEQFHQLRLKRVSEWLKLAVQTITVAIGALFLMLIGGMVWQAAHSRAVVIDAFSVPPDLAQQGLTGQTLARQLQDRVAQYGEEANTARAAASYEDGWGKDVKVEIPETGMSLSELERFLRERFGHDQHISGEVFHSGDKLAVAVRVGEEPAARVDGDASNLGDLVDKAALDVFARTEPYRYAAWLSKQPGRGDEAKAAFSRLTASPSKDDRIWAWIALNSSSQAWQARRDLEHALAIDPAFGHVWFDLIFVDADLGHDEAALADARTGLRYTPHEGGRRVTALAADWDLAFETAMIAHETSDYAGEIAAWRSMEGRPDYTLLTNRSAVYTVDDWARLHDPQQATALMGTASDDRSFLEQKFKGYVVATPHAILAADRGDWAEAARQLEAVQSGPGSSIRNAAPTVAKPLLAIAWAHLGRIADAERLAASTPADCYDCVIARAVVADLKGDRAAADRWFAEAVRQGPSLPRAWQAWGERLLARGDLDGAEGKFKAAAQLGPRWADPLKGLGDVAMRRGDPAMAARDYDQALERAPAWAAAKASRSAAQRGS